MENKVRGLLSKVPYLSTLPTVPSLAGLAFKIREPVYYSIFACIAFEQISLGTAVRILARFITSRSFVGW